MMIMMMVMMMMMMWIEVMAIPYPFSTTKSSSLSSSSSSLNFPRHKRDESIPDDMFLCLLTADSEGRDGSECESSPRPSPPSCTCVPVWQCLDKGVATDVKNDSLSPIVLDLRLNLKCEIPEGVCCVQVDLQAPPPTPPPVTLSCGQRNIFGVGNTFLNLAPQQSQYGEFPWTVVMFTEVHIETFVYPIFVAGGSLVHKQLVLTAAHSAREYVEEIHRRPADSSSWGMELGNED